MRARPFPGGSLIHSTGSLTTRPFHGSFWGAAAFAALLLAVVALPAPPAAAAGARPPFQMPFRCGERWEADTRSGHRAIDWNFGNGSDDLGRRVTAAASGI